MPKLKRVGDAGNRGATDFVESLDRGLRVLEVFGSSQQPMTLSDLAKGADLPRATARRILFTLERAGFVATDGKLFRLMPRVLVLHEPTRGIDVGAKAEIQALISDQHSCAVTAIPDDAKGERLVAFYTDPDDRGRGMVGQHGSLTPAETAVPLLRYGAFARG